MIVPLYRRIFIDVARASNVFETLFLEDSLFLRNIISAYNDPDWGTKENPFVWRMYLAASRSYRDFKSQKSSNEILKHCYMDYPFPRFIWILEMGTIQTYKNRKARVEVILDATSSPYSESTFGIISIGYKNHYIFVPEISMDEIDEAWHDNDKINMQELSDSDCYLSSLEQKNNERMLTKMFFLLYNSVCDFYEETYDIYQNNNLEEV